MTAVFDLAGPLLEGVFAVEASAGTGKTYSLTGLVARHVAERGLRPDQLLMVTFTRAATADMRDRTRTACRALLGVLETDAAERQHLDVDSWMVQCLAADEDENARRAGHLRSFLATYDEATITTIHGYCQLVLNRAGLLSPAIGNVTLVGDASDTVAEVIADLLIGPLSRSPDIFGESPTGTERSIDTSIKNLKKAVKAVMSNPSTVRIPVRASDDLSVSLASPDPEVRWSAMVEHIVDVVHERRRAAGVFGYDDLIHSVVAMLLGVDGDRLVRSLREQYRLVLIDEFQDTDVGQWTIFDETFVRALPDPTSASAPQVSLGVVGDPKQAIYRFRGADIDAYRSAIASLEHRVELLTNYRSNARLIDAVNALFEGVTFGDPSIAYRQVSARTGDPGEGVVGRSPVDIRYVPYSVEAGSSITKSKLRKAEKIEYENGTLDKWNSNTDAALEIVYADMVASISDLIHSGRVVDKSGQVRDVRPGDIAVLVRSHSHAERIRDVFSAAGVPSVRYRARSVFESPAALEWRIFLSALASPSRMDRVRAAAVTVFGHARLESLLGSPDGHGDIDAWQRRCAALSADVQRHGLSTVYFRLRSDTSFMTRVMSEVEGERLLTDLDHIAEVLSTIPELAQGAAPVDCLQILERLVDEAGEEDEFQRRIETDAESVHIATIHHSKGLEFPIVYLPTLMKMFPGPETPYIFSSDGRRVIDLASSVEWEWSHDALRSNEDRKEAADADITGDLMRMLYVAVTRAEQMVVMYWTPLRSSAESSLGRLLFAPRDNDRPVIDPESGVPAPGDIPKANARMRAELETIAGRSPGIVLTDVTAAAPERAGVRRTAREPDRGRIAEFTRREPVRRPGWGKWSYSGIANSLGTVQSAMAEPFVPGADEGRSRVLGTSGTGSDESPVLFPDQLFGAAFGSQIHEIFEALDVSSTHLAVSIREQVERRFARRMDESAVRQMARAIEAVCRTPLGPMFGGSDLAGIPGQDRRAEMVFDMRIADTPIPVSTIGHLLVRHLDAGDPFVAYGESLIERADRIRMAGFLYGEIDALFRIQRDDGSWSAVVSDYKTNLLHEPGSAGALDAYRRENLTRVMAEDHYVLQALFYQVAVHRYLRWRVPDYRPGVHLGGIAYLFVRGLVGRDSPVGHSGEPTGMFSWNPPLSLIEALDAEMSP